MDNKNVILSIIIPCYNCASTLEDAVTSILKQNLDIPYEIVMVDDASTDNTPELIKAMALRDERIRIFFHPTNRGGGATRNTAVKNSQGKLIFCLDSDDILPENTLPRMITLLEEKHADGILFEETRFFTGTPGKKEQSVKNRCDGKAVALKDMFAKNVGFMARVNFLYTKKAFDTIGGYPEHHGFDTQTFGLNFLAKGLQCYVCPNTFYYHRRNEKPSYFDREHREGRLSLNAYFMYEEIFFLFSSTVKNKIITFDVFTRATLGADNLENMVAIEFASLGELGFFVPHYDHYLVPDGKKKYIEKITGNAAYPTSKITPNRSKSPQNISMKRIKSQLARSFWVRSFYFLALWLYKYPGYIRDMIKFKKLSAPNPRFSYGSLFPCLFDNTKKTGFDPHYTYHPAWAARVIAQNKPSKHIDISSILHFSTLVSAFVPVEFYDYRPAEVRLDNLACKRGDLLNLPFETNSVESLSCMHTIEHVGLGRYGDPIDPDGDRKAAKELSRVVKPGGTFIFVAPLGNPRIEFNAHRVYSYKQVIGLFPDLQLKEFSLVPDDFKTHGLIKNADPELVAKQTWACGCFWFVKA